MSHVLCLDTVRFLRYIFRDLTFIIGVGDGSKVGGSTKII